MKSNGFEVFICNSVFTTNLAESLVIKSIRAFWNNADRLHNCSDTRLNVILDL